MLHAIADVIEREPRDAGRRGELGERQAGARDARGRPPPGRRPLPVLRRCHAVPGGPHHRGRQGHRRLPLPRAARRRGPDHPVQLPAAHGRLEDRSRTGRGQLHRRQARLAHPVVDPQAAWSCSSTSCRGRHQRRDRPRRRDRQGARHEPPHREDRLHGRDRDGQADHAVRRGEPHPVDRGARRQVAERLLRRPVRPRRRVPRQGDRGARALRLQQGRGLHLPVAGADPGVGLRPVHGARTPADRAHHPGQPPRHADDDRRAGLDPAAREDRGTTSTSARGRERRSHRRLAGRRGRHAQGRLLLPADGAQGRTTPCASSKRRSSGRCSR